MANLKALYKEKRLELKLEIKSLSSQLAQE